MKFSIQHSEIQHFSFLLEIRVDLQLKPKSLFNAIEKKIFFGFTFLHYFLGHMGLCLYGSEEADKPSPSPGDFPS